MVTSLDNILTELRKRLDTVNTKISAWEKVERNRKKDGSDFASLGKNFKNATLYDSQTSLVPEKAITVHAWSQFSGYVEDDIKNRALVRYEKNRQIPEGRIIKESYLEPYYYKTVDEIFEDISCRIAGLKRQKEEIESDIENAEQVFNLFKARIDTALTELKLSCNSGLYYLTRDYMSSAY